MDREPIAEKLIHDHTTYALLAGAIPVPLVDIAAVAAVQLDLVRALSRVYEVEFDPATGKGLIAALLGASAARVGASVAKAIPGIGWVPTAIANAGLSGASTYAVGHVFANHFEQQGTLKDFDPESSRSVFDQFFQRGRDLVARLRSPGRQSAAEVTSLLERLGRLRASGVIDEEEFERLKGEALGRVG